MQKIVEFLEQNPRFVALAKDTEGDWRIFEYSVERSLVSPKTVGYTDLLDPNDTRVLTDFSYSRPQIEALRVRINELPASFWSKPVHDRWEEEPPITLVKDSVVFLQVGFTLSPVEALNSAPSAAAVPQ